MIIKGNKQYNKRWIKGTDFVIQDVDKAPPTAHIQGVNTLIGQTVLLN